MQPVRGFTLVELVVTIAVLAIIAAISIPSFSNIMHRQQLNAATESLVSLLEEARTQSVLQHQDKSVGLDGSQKTASDKEPDYVWKSPNVTKLSTDKDENSVRLITFNRYGAIVNNQQITIILNNLNHKKMINITPLGNISSN